MVDFLPCLLYIKTTSERDLFEAFIGQEKWLNCPLRLNTQMSMWVLFQDSLEENVNLPIKKGLDKAFPSPISIGAEFLSYFFQPHC